MGIDTVLFVNNWGQIFHNDVCIMTSVNIWGFRGPVIAVDSVAARMLVECPLPTKRFFFTQEYAWNHFPFEDNLKMYADPTTTIIVENNFDREIFQATFHDNVKVIPDLDPKELAKCLN